MKNILTTAFFLVLNFLFLTYAYTQNRVHLQEVKPKTVFVQNVNDTSVFALPVEAFPVISTDSNTVKLDYSNMSINLTVVDTTYRSNLQLSAQCKLTINTPLVHLSQLTSTVPILVYFNSKTIIKIVIFFEDKTTYLYTL